jgi:hypothetical protein
MRLAHALSPAAAVVTLSLLVAPVRAQVAPVGGITVTGRGVVRVHADIMRLSAFIGPQPQRYPPRGGSTTDGPGAGSVPTSPPAAVDEAAEAIAKALRDGGVADATSSMTAFNPVAMSSTCVITGTLHNPTRSLVDALARAGNLAAAPYPNMTLQNLVLSLFASDCSAAETRAQEAALSDARSHAERAAHAAGIRLGTIIAVNETAAGVGGVQSCETRPDMQFSQQVRTDGEEVASGDVFVTTVATVTYAIVH